MDHRLFGCWLSIKNIAVLLGAEVNAELERQRAVEAGLPEDVEPFVELVDTRKLDDDGGGGWTPEDQPHERGLTSASDPQTGWHLARGDGRCRAAGSRARYRGVAAIEKRAIASSKLANVEVMLVPVKAHAARPAPKMSLAACDETLPRTTRSP